MVSSEGFVADSEKVEIMINWPIPKISTKIHQFHGLASFYQKFIKIFSTISTPMIEILKDESFRWNEAA